MGAKPAEIAILTGGGDRPYALGLASSLITEGIRFDFIGSDELESPELRHNPLTRVLNLRGPTLSHASPVAKIARILRYYVRLVVYAAANSPPTFHILWNNKLEYVDRTLLLIYYRIMGKRLVHTVHNVNVRKRDGRDTFMNRWTLRAQYHLVDHLFVHTQQMRQELHSEFDVALDRISLIPFGINSTVPDTSLTSAEARRALGLAPKEKVVLFFGNIAPYKGLEYLIEAMRAGDGTMDFRLVVAGRLKCSADYWTDIGRRITELGLESRIIRRIEFVPDAETELYFKAADVLALPYTHVFQSGVLFLAYNFGLPVVATDVGSLRDDVVEGRTGFMCAPRDPASLSDAIRDYFASDLFASLVEQRPAIRRFAEDRYSWTKVGAITRAVYRKLAAQASLPASKEGQPVR